MPINKFLYFGDFVAIPLALIVLIYLALSVRGIGGAPDLAISLLIGIGLWTLAEYLIHRFVYHHAPVFSPLHDAHHRQPDEYIGVPSFVSSGFIVAVCYLPIYPFDSVAAAGFTGGTLIGYAGYMFVHHATHHWTIEPGDWLYEARLRHMSHHYHESANFGVSTGFWDRVFGTARMPRGRLART